MENDAYLTISGAAEGFFKDRGSKFLGFAFPVKDEETIKTHLQALKKEYYDARHYCYAFIIGRDSDFYRAGDDGEPANSAGAPILGQIRSKELSDVLVVVVRYFGGTKLGVPGLINAYKTAAAEALEAAETITVLVKEQVVFHFKYPDMNEVMRWIKEYDMEIISQTFEMDCKIRANIRESLLLEMQNRAALFPNILVK
jgi:uncharacterized YigZ family protein